MHINRNRLLERFLQYVKIGSTANPNTQDYPSSRGQWLLGELLVKQMKSFGIEDAQQDVNGLVWGTVPATTPGPAPRPDPAGRGRRRPGALHRCGPG